MLVTSSRTEEETVMSDVSGVVDAYFEMWNTDDADERLGHAQRAFTDDARYVDPLSDVVGPQGASAMVGGLRADHAGYAVRRASELDVHHNVVRFGWEILDPDGAVYLNGIDVCALADDGRIVMLAGFFGAALDAASTASIPAASTSTSSS
jgi:hypothetical protein